MILQKPNYLLFRIQRRLGIVLTVVFLGALIYNVHNFFSFLSKDFLWFIRDSRIIAPFIALIFSIVSIFFDIIFFKFGQVLIFYCLGIIASIYSRSMSLHSFVFFLFSILLALQFGFLYRKVALKLSIPLFLYLIAIGINSYQHGRSILPDVLIMLVISLAAIYLVWIIFTEEVNRLTNEKKALEAEMERNRIFVKFGMNVAGMIHNLKSILNSVFGFQEVIEDSDNVGDIKEFLALQKSASNSLFTHIQNLLETVKLYQQPERSCISLARIVELTLEVMNCQMDFKHSIVVRTELDKTAVIYASPLEIMQLLDNILKNSWEAMREIKATEISVACFQQGGLVKLIISDSGGGIPWFIGKGKIDILRSKDVAPGKTTKKDGIGMGLLYVQNLMKELQGAFYLTTDKKGTTTEFHFPSCKASGKPK